MTENIELAGSEFFDPMVKKAPDWRCICRVEMICVLIAGRDR